MITIEQPYIYNADDKCRLESKIHNGLLNKDYQIWYEVEKEYGQYLCSELADAFLLAVLPLAAVTEQDICIHANISPKLLHNARKVHALFYATLFEKKVIRIFADRSELVLFDGKAVATGCSMGVDYLSTIYQYSEKDCQPEYRLTHLCLFNSCQLGDLDQDKLNQNLYEASRSATQFANEIGLPFLLVNSNITELSKDSNLSVTQVSSYYTISCPMALQKLFGKYIMASSYHAKYVCFEKEDIMHTESVFLPLMGNENMEVVLADTFKSRVDKTAAIMGNPLTPKYLDVCWATQIANMHGGGSWYLNGKKHKNCGWCDKCMRTLFTLELLDGVENYRDTFDLDKYYENRKKFITKVVAYSKIDFFYTELYELMKKRGFPIPFLGAFLRTTGLHGLAQHIYGIVRSFRK